MEFVADDGVSVFLYSQFKLISHCGRLFRMSRLVEVADIRFTQSAIHRREGLWYSRGLRWTFFPVKCSEPNDGFIPTLCVPKWVLLPVYIETINPRFHRIQRWMKATAMRMVQARRLALAMALHVRLGERSGLQCLGEDLIPLCNNINST